MHKEENHIADETTLPYTSHLVVYKNLAQLDIIYTLE